jgi:hypothetical protein
MGGWAEVAKWENTPALGTSVKVSLLPSFRGTTAKKSIRAVRGVAPNHVKTFLPRPMSETQGVRDVTVFVLGRHQPVTETCQAPVILKGCGHVNDSVAPYVALPRIFQD